MYYTDLYYGKLLLLVTITFSSFHTIFLFLMRHSIHVHRHYEFFILNIFCWLLPLYSLISFCFPFSSLCPSFTPFPCSCSLTLSFYTALTNLVEYFSFYILFYQLLNYCIRTYNPPKYGLLNTWTKKTDTDIKRIKFFKKWWRKAGENKAQENKKLKKNEEEMKWGRNGKRMKRGEQHLETHA